MFIFDDKAWSFSFNPESHGVLVPSKPAYLNIRQSTASAYTSAYEFVKKQITQEKIDQKPISEILSKKAAAIQARSQQE